MSFSQNVIWEKSWEKSYISLCPLHKEHMRKIVHHLTLASKTSVMKQLLGVLKWFSVISMTVLQHQSEPYVSVHNRRLFYCHLTWATREWNRILIWQSQMVFLLQNTAQGFIALAPSLHVSAFCCGVHLMNVSCLTSINEWKPQNLFIYTYAVWGLWFIYMNVDNLPAENTGARAHTCCWPWDLMIGSTAPCWLIKIRLL